MKTISKLTGLLVTVLVTTLVLWACKKQDDASGTADREEFASVSSESDAAAEVVFDDVFNNVMGVSSEVAIGGTGVFGRVDVSSSSNGNRIDGVDSITCYVVTTKQLSTSTRFPLQITIDFGSGCIGKDGRTRKGRIIVLYTGHLGTSGNSATASFDGFYLDNIKVEGTYKLTNTGTTGQKSYTIQIINAKLSNSNGDYIQWSSEKTITQIEGGATPLLALDDVYNITGGASGAVSAGNKYFQWSTVITAALRKKFGCRWITLGTLSLKKGNDAVAVLDYGPGTCDNKASFTVNGVSHEITLH
ncbi:hypothetical protein A3860_19060 [Niastella vici]|uniref:Uncharacterized protein n=1 Tax=Niastella vici TaxID=1703345 RepID=A0A1V9G2I1_9BACT|nr:hypothetical protein [Niastella vici]OQP64855.1 hypothetical protein A3860_19060 [Niastella vici]